MFSALTSDLKKDCGERHIHRAWTHMAQLMRRHKEALTLQLFLNLLRITTPCVSNVAHRKVVDSAGVLQQLLKWDGPAQHTVGRACLSARSPWEAQAAASTAPCRHVQLYTTSRHKHTHLSAQKSVTERETKSDIFSCNTHSRTDMLQLVETLVVHAYLRLTLPGSVNREIDR